MNDKVDFAQAEAIILRKKFLRDWSAIEYKYNSPCALEQEERYASYGIKLPFKIYYKYKMPFGLESTYDLLFWWHYADKMSKLPNSEEEWAERLRIDINNMRKEDKERMDFYRTVPYGQMEAVFEWAKTLSADKVIAEIKRLNPELAHIKTDGKTSGVSNPVEDFIHGVIYGFSPEDIELCLTAKRGELQKIAENPRYQKLRFGHFTTPERYEALLAAEQQIQQIEQAKQNNGK